MTTQEALEDVHDERKRQIEIGMDGQVTDVNGLILVAMAYLGRASDPPQRNNELNQREMLVKAAAVLIDAIERSE